MFGKKFSGGGVAHSLSRAPRLPAGRAHKTLIYGFYLCSRACGEGRRQRRLQDWYSGGASEMLVPQDSLSSSSAANARSAAQLTCRSGWDERTDARRPRCTKSNFALKICAPAIKLHRINLHTTGGDCRLHGMLWEGFAKLRLTCEQKWKWHEHILYIKQFQSV